MKLPQDAERFKNLSDGFKNIAVAFAVVVGGTWTAYTFWSLKSAEIAQLDYDQKKERRPAIEVDLKTDLIDAEVDNYNDPKLRPRNQLLIQVTASIKNSGNYPALIDLSNESVVVSRLNSGTGDGNAAVQTGSRSFNVLGAKGKVDAFFLSPGNTTAFQYMIDVKYSGIHIVEFRVPQDPLLIRMLSSAKKPPNVSKNEQVNQAAPTHLSTAKIIYISSARLSSPKP
jgi:hypothetical protein